MIMKIYLYGKPLELNKQWQFRQKSEAKNQEDWWAYYIIIIIKPANAQSHFFLSWHRANTHIIYMLPMYILNTQESSEGIMGDIYA